MSARKDILFAEVLETAMVGEDEDLVLGTFEVVSPVTESFDDDV